MWEKKSKSSWKLDSRALEGSASVRQVEGGYKVFLKVTDKEFGMVLRDKEEFFQSKKKAAEEVRKGMREFQD